MVMPDCMQQLVFKFRMVSCREPDEYIGKLNYRIKRMLIRYCKFVFRVMLTEVLLYTGDHEYTPARL